MDKIIGFIKKLVKWVIAFIPTILGFVEVALKFVKEVLTLIVDILFPIIPIEKFKTIVLKIRAIVDAIYDWISNNKTKILKYIGL